MAVHESSTLKRQLRGALGQALPVAQGGARHSLRALLSPLALIMGRISTMALGFLSWLLAARLFSPAEVGLASGAISAMMLCVQVALLGVGSAVIALYPRHQERPAPLLDTAFSIVVGAALAAGGLFLVVASSAFDELSVVSAVPVYTLLFLALSVLGTVGVLFDHASIALRRGDQVLSRNVLNGSVMLVGIGALPLLAGATSSLAIFTAWVLGALSACVLGVVQLWRTLSHYRYRLRFEPPLARRLLGIGLPNYALTLTERAPGPILPIVATELLSPVDNAYWYAVWMMAWGVCIIPISIGQMLFAEAAEQPAALSKGIRRSIRSSLALGGLGVIGLTVMAPVALALLGPSYAIAGTTPLRILVLMVLPFTFVQAYFAACRARQRLLEAILTGTLSGLVGVGAAAAAGMATGLTGMASAWLVTQSVTGIWAAWRLQSLAQQARAEAASGDAQLSAGTDAVPKVVPADAAAS